MWISSTASNVLKTDVVSTLGVKEQIISPEINIDKVNKITGMDITIVTTAKTDAEALVLLKELGIPFKNQRTEEIK